MSGVISRAIQDRALPLDPNDQPILLSEYLKYCGDKDPSSEEETAALVQDFLEFQESLEFRERRLMSAWHQMAAEEMIPVGPEEETANE